MTETENKETYRWEAAMRELYNEKGVRVSRCGSYETFISVHGKTLSCGTYSTKKQAREAVVSTKIKLFKENVIAHGEDPFEIIESVERGYFVSPSGNVYNRHGDLMVGDINHCGYRHILLNRKNRDIHRVIAETFIPNPNNLPCVNHKDGNKLNNSVENLEWCTHSHNTLHAYQCGLEHKRCGESNHTHRLTEENVKYIKSHYKKGDPQYGATALAKLFGVHRTTVRDIVNGRTWKGITV